MELEVKVMWCKGLTAFNFFQKLAVYAAVYITPNDKNLKLTQDQIQEQKTPIDQDGDGNPEWNHIMKFNLSPPIISSNLEKLALVFELRNQGQLFGYNKIGEVRVLLRDLVDSVGVGVGRLASYEVRGSDGKHNGVLDFSYKVINREDLGNSPTDSPIQISGFENQCCCPHEQLDFYSGTEKIQYPKIESELGLYPNPNLNPNPNSGSLMPSIWTPGNQTQYWAPPPPGPPLPACYEERPPPPPPPRFFPPPPPPEQQPYAYRPPAYGDPYWNHGPPPDYHQQQPTGDGCEYPHW